MSLEAKIIEFSTSPWLKGLVVVGLATGAIATIVAFVNSNKSRQLLNLDIELRKLQITQIKKDLQIS